MEIFSGLLEQFDTLESTNPNLKKGGKKKNAKAYGNQNASTSPKQSSRPCLYGLLYGDSGVTRDENKVAFEKTLRDILDGVSSGGIDEDQFSRLILNILKIYHTVIFKIQLSRNLGYCYHPRLHCLILYSVEKNKWISVR